MSTMLERTTTKTRRQLTQNGLAPDQLKWLDRHENELKDPYLLIKQGQAITLMLKGLEAYCDMYKQRFDAPIGGDRILGDNGAELILKGLIALLNGDHGDLDAGICHSAMLALARKHEMGGIEQ
jgi:hypothetical protein